MTYNGWKNYETWNIALWLDNDGQQPQSGATGDEVREFVEEVYGPTQTFGPLVDIWNNVLSNVDWDEIADHYKDDEEEEDEEE